MVKYSVTVEMHKPFKSAADAQRMIDWLDRQIAAKKSEIMAGTETASMPIGALDKQLDCLAAIASDRLEVFLVWREMYDDERERDVLRALY